MKEKRPLAKLGTPKIRGYLARRANTALFLYRRRRLETWLIACDFDGTSKKGGGKKKTSPMFTVGARFTGRFFPTRCSLSPDGKRFVYFVMTGSRQANYKEQHYCWTAMCKPPNLTAEFLLPHGDTWGGGGLFLDDRNLVIFKGMHHPRKDIATLDGQTINRVKIHVAEGFDDIPIATQAIRLIDDGWRGTQSWHMLSGRWRKKAGKARLLARFRDDWQAHGDFDCYRYYLVDWKRKSVLPDATMEDVQWADFDRSNRLWLTRGQTIEIYEKPGPDMPEKPSKVIDLEQVLQRSRA